MTSAARPPRARLGGVGLQEDGRRHQVELPRAAPHGGLRAGSNATAQSCQSPCRSEEGRAGCADAGDYQPSLQTLRHRGAGAPGLLPEAAPRRLRLHPVQQARQGVA